MNVFYVIFARAPHAKKLFPFKDAEGDELREHPEFRAHARHFMKVIGDALEDVEDLEGRLGRRLLVLGAEHASKPGFSLDYFEVFTGGLGEVWATELGEAWTSETRASWEKLFLYLLMELRAGYMMAVEGEKLEEQGEEEEEETDSSDKPPNGRETITLIPPRVVVSPPLSGPGTT